MKHTIDGGTYRKVVSDGFDLTPYAGLRAKIEGMPVTRCSVCGAELVDGVVIEAALDMLALKIVAGKKGLLRPAEAVFLRKRMGLTQAELAKKVGCNRVTLARWESTPTISPSNDLLLRTVFVVDRGQRRGETDARLFTPAGLAEHFAAIKALGEVRHGHERGGSPVVVDHFKKLSSRAA